jgi:Zn-dependent protease with chaperone function
MKSSRSSRSKIFAIIAGLTLLFIFPVLNTFADKVTIHRSGVLLREGPGNFYPVLAMLGEGSILETLGEPQIGWQKVKSGSREVEQGWISVNVLRADPSGTMTDIQDISSKSKLSGSVTNTAISAMIKGLRAGTEGDKLSSLALSPPVDAAQSQQFRSGFETSGTIEPPLPASAAGMSLLPEIVAASPVIAVDLAEQWGGRLTSADAYLNMIYLWLAEQAGASTLAPVVITARSGMNAQALPGGWVVVGGGLLSVAADESELAGVLAHELSHGALHHGIKGLEREGWRAGAEDAFAELEAETSSDDIDVSDLEDYSKQVLASARRHYGLGEEMQADSLSTVILARAGYDPSGLLRFLQRLKEQEGGRLTGQGDINIAWFQSRQELDRRIAALEKQLRHYKREMKRGKREADRFRARMSGMIR